MDLVKEIPETRLNSDLIRSEQFHTEDLRIDPNAFQIRTIEDGFNSGRVYYVQIESKEELKEAVQTIRAFVKSAKDKADGASRLRSVRQGAQAVHNSPYFQALSSFLIFLVSKMSLM